jgi:hypothetical protein
MSQTNPRGVGIALVLSPAVRESVNAVAAWPSLFAGSSCAAGSAAVFFASDPDDVLFEPSCPSGSLALPMNCLDQSRILPAGPLFRVARASHRPRSRPIGHPGDRG